MGSEHQLFTLIFATVTPDQTITIRRTEHFVQYFLE